MKTLKIEIPKGFVIDKFDEETGDITFKEKPKNVMERIKTFEDVLADNNITKELFNNTLVGLTADEIAYKQIKLICKSLNEGWEPDWDNSSEYKYYPLFKMSSSGFRCNDCGYWATSSAVGSRLCFRSSELAKYACIQFTEIYKNHLLIK